MVLLVPLFFMALAFGAIVAAGRGLGEPGPPLPWLEADGRKPLIAGTTGPDSSTAQAIEISERGSEL